MVNLIFYVDIPIDPMDHEEFGVFIVEVLEMFLSNEGAGDGTVVVEYGGVKL